MPVSHNAAENTITAGALERLNAYIEARRQAPTPVTDWETFEQELHGLFLAAECEFMSEELTRQDVDVPFIEIAGERYHRVLRCETRYEGVAGELRVERTLYRGAHDRLSLSPLELGVGIVEGHWTPLAAHQMAWVSVHLTPSEGEALFDRLGGMRPSKSSLDRLPKGLSHRWEANQAPFETVLQEESRVPDGAVSMAISLDGVMVPLRKNEYPGPATDAGYREASCGTVSFFDAAGERLETRRLARMPEPGKATLKTLLTQEVNAALAEQPQLQIVKLADGAQDNWRYLAEAFPEGIELVDYFHALGHLEPALAAAYGKGSTQAEADFKKYRHLLKEETEGVEKVIRHLRYLAKKKPKSKALKDALCYFRNHRHRMGYANVVAAHLPIGSGVVEAACKTLVTQRLKRSGMRWGIDGGQAILTLRALVQSERFDPAWRLLAETYKKEITLPENVIEFPRRAVLNLEL